MAYETITVEPLTARIGGIVRGADLTKPVSQVQIDEIRAAYSFERRRSSGTSTKAGSP